MLSMPKVVDSEQRRAELTRVTAGEIARVGLDGVTLREIARAGGWTTGIVSHYFVDKRDLLLATFRSRAEPLEIGSTSRRRGASMLDAIIDSALPLDEERALNWKVWLAFWGAAVGDPELTAAQQDRHRSFHRAIAQALAAEQAADGCDRTSTSTTRLDALSPCRRHRRASSVRAAVLAAAVQRRIVAEHVATLR